MTFDEERVCRFCGDSDHSEVLFHPCRCSGSIRHIHETCLIKWLTLKSNQPLIDPLSLPDVEQTMCELCGHRFAFSTEYSKDLTGYSGVLVSLSIALDVGRSILERVIGCSLPMIRLVIILVVFPLLLGAVFLAALAGLANNGLEVYEYSVLSLSQSGIRQYLIGSLALMLGTAILDRSRRNNFVRNRRSLSAFLGSLVGLGAGLLGLAVPYWIGRRIVEKFASACPLRMADSAVCVSLMRVGKPLRDLSSDMLVVFAGSLFMGIGVTVAILIAKAYTAGLSAMFGNFILYLKNLVKTACGLAVPVLVGHSMMRLGLAPAWALPEPVVACVIGCSITVLTVLFQRFICDSLLSSEQKRRVSWFTHTVIYGRVSGETLSLAFTATLIRSGVHFFTFFLSIFPCVKLFLHLKILPLLFFIHPSTASNSFVLPFELFYLHVLIPLLLNPPPLPRRVQGLISSFQAQVQSAVNARQFRCEVLFLSLLFMSVWIAMIALIALPTIVGRLVFPKTDDLLAYCAGLLALVLAIHIAFRIGATQDDNAHTEPQASDSPRTLTSHLKRICIFCLCTVISVLLLPLLIGIAFQISLVLPLRRTVHPLNSVIHNLVPLWIIGVMLVKIFFALVTLGLLPRISHVLEEIKSLYARDGLLSDCMHILVMRKLVAPGLLRLLAFCYVPYAVGAYLKLGENTVLVFWAVYSGFRYLIPAAIRFAESQKRIALHRKYLIRTKLVNFDDS